MTKKTGQFAKVEIKVDAATVPVLELREWTINVSSEKIDANVAGDDWADHVIGRLSWEGEATCVSVDEYWLDLVTKKVEISFYDDATDTLAAYKGTASIDFERGTPHDDLIESTITFTGAGALTTPKGDAPVGP